MTDLKPAKQYHIRISSGRLVDPFRLTYDDIHETDFPHTLAIINRFTGHSKYPFSVGQHTVNLVAHVPKHLRKTALIHDFSEAYFNDIAAPVKARFTEYKAEELKAQQTIFDYFKVPWETMEEFEEYDKRIFMDERVILYDVVKENGQGMGDERKPLGVAQSYLKETPWRTVRDDMARLMIEEFSQLKAA